MAGFDPEALLGVGGGGGGSGQGKEGLESAAEMSPQVVDSPMHPSLLLPPGSTLLLVLSTYEGGSPPEGARWFCR